MRKLLSSIEDARVSSALRASVSDAVLWALMFGLAENYVIPFAVLFGAGTLMTSLIQGSAQLAIAAGQLAGAELARTVRSRKRLAIVTNLIHASSWLAVFAGALVFKSPLAVLAGYSLGILATSLAGPSWLSWMNELVPESMRGAFWGARNRVAGLAQFGAVVAAAVLLEYGRGAGMEIEAFGIIFVLAFIFRGLSFFPLSRQWEPPAERELRRGPGMLAFVARLPRHRFGRFVLFSVLTSFAVNVMAPVLQVYLLKSLALDYVSYMLVTMSHMVVNFLAMSYWGPLSDRFGNYRILFITACAIPILPIGWMFLKALPLILLIQVMAGFLWAGFNLSTTNFIFDTVPKRQMARTMAYFNTLNNACAFSGSLLGGLLGTLFVGLNIPIFAEGNFEIVFGISTALRFVVIAFLLKSFKEVRPVEPSPKARFFFIYQPLTMLMSRIQLIRAARERRIDRR
jgi:MFS family permease